MIQAMHGMSIPKPEAKLSELTDMLRDSPYRAGSCVPYHLYHALFPIQHSKSPRGNGGATEEAGAYVVCA
ncbi:hypothetical protein GCM10025794_27670 [Massilia kyonggiensis]